MEKLDGHYEVIDFPKGVSHTAVWPTGTVWMISELMAIIALFPMSFILMMIMMIMNTLLTVMTGDTWGSQTPAQFLIRHRHLRRRRTAQALEAQADSWVVNSVATGLLSQQSCSLFYSTHGGSISVNDPQHRAIEPTVSSTLQWLPSTVKRTWRLCCKAVGNQVKRVSDSIIVYNPVGVL